MRKKRYWVSWWDSSDDVRPLTYPPNESVLGWWVSGQRGLDDGQKSICAMVSADSEEEAQEAIYKDWPKDSIVEWRFLTAKDDGFELSDRFPIDPDSWMGERMKEDA